MTTNQSARAVHGEVKRGDADPQSKAPLAGRPPTGGGEAPAHGSERFTTMQGVLSPVLTPFRADLSVDTGLLARQCRWLYEADVGAAIFGTNSEGNSISA